MIVPRLQEFLDEKKAIYEHRTHRVTYTAKDLANADHIPSWEVAKTVVFLGDGVYALAVLPGNAKIDLQKLRQTLGLTSIRLAAEDELICLFPDSETGAMPPFGNLYNNIPVYIDESLASHDEIAFNGGTHRDVVHMKFRDLVRLVHPTIVPFAVRP